MPDFIDIKNTPWIIDFFEQEQQYGYYDWPAYEPFSYQEQVFQFQYSVFARLRKEPSQGYVYEVIANQKPLGAGAYGYVQRIAYTISKNNQGMAQIKDKGRAVKIQKAWKADEEYAVARYAKYLHIKPPMAGFMVMQEKPGVTLYAFLKETQLSAKLKLALTQTLVKAIKNQLIANCLIHQDLHRENILVHMDPSSPDSPFEITIIDFGQGIYDVNYRFSTKSEDYLDLQDIVYKIWQYQSHTPAFPFLANLSFDELIEEIDTAIIAPIRQLQPLLNNLVAYLRKLKNTHADLAQELKNSLKNGADASTPEDMEKLQAAIKTCKNRLQEHGLDYTLFLETICDSNPRYRKLLGFIFAYFRTLEDKGQELIKKSYVAEAEQLSTLVKDLREATFLAAYSSLQERHQVFSVCQNKCKAQLEQHQNLLNIHRNKDYIWAEIGIILSSLIVLYPVLLGIHYYYTGKLGFFMQTNATQGIEKIDEYFTHLKQI